MIFILYNLPNCLSVMKKQPQIYRDVSLILDFWMNRKWSDSIPKIWRFTIYSSVIGYVLEMVSASSDAYEMSEGREENIRKIISNLNKVMLVSRVFSENGVISYKQINYLDELSEKINSQAKKWLNSIKSKKDK